MSNLMTRTLLTALLLLFLSQKIWASEWTCQIRNGYYLPYLKAVENFDEKETFNVLMTREAFDSETKKNLPDILLLKGGFFGDTMREFELLNETSEEVSFISNTSLFHFSGVYPYPNDNSIKVRRYNYSSSDLKNSIGHQGVCFTKVQK